MGLPTNQVSLGFSYLSTVATSFAIIGLSIWIPEKKVSLRWILILNMLLAELINASNNSISGIFAYADALRPSMGCTANGFIGQLSIQAADFSTLAIAVVTFITLRKGACSVTMKKLEHYSRGIIAGIWIYPLTTATVGLFWPGYAPTSSNWCWLDKNTIARYSLTHGPRVIIFTVIVILYSISAYQLLSAASGYGSSNDVENLENAEEAKATKKKIINATIRLMAFPIAYLIIWAPGMVNRCKILET